ncbi:MAG: hypothetical protein DHS20C15_21530 [Planctomycetota bacterium]|nr:MAG: hypothetical protein DHS20C15_21530 [Planctomycetota bacterium]
MHLAILTQVLDRRDAVLGFFHTWCAVFAEHCEQLTVYAQRVGEVQLPDNVTVISLGKERGAGKAGMLATLWRQLARQPKPDALWCHMVPKFVLYAAPVAKLRGIPIHLWYTHKGVDRALKMSVPLIRKAFSASRESFRLDSAAGKVVITGHGIDGEHFATQAGVRPVDVLAVGRLAPSKGQDELLEALSLVDPMPRTQIAGDILLERDAPWRDRLAARAAEFDGRVELLGAVPYVEVAEFMRGAKLLVNTSRTGSVDKVVLEAMAAGALPLTCNESFEPILGDVRGGELMFDRDDPQQLAERVRALLALPADEAVALRAELRARVLRDHDLAVLVPRMIAEMEASA